MYQKTEQSIQTQLFHPNGCVIKKYALLLRPIIIRAYRQKFCCISSIYGKACTKLVNAGQILKGQNGCLAICFN